MIAWEGWSLLRGSPHHIALVTAHLHWTKKNFSGGFVFIFFVPGNTAVVLDVFSWDLSQLCTVITKQPALITLRPIEA